MTIAVQSVEAVEAEAVASRTDWAAASAAAPAAKHQ